MADLRARLTTALRRAGAASSDFDLNPGAGQTGGQALRAAAVLVPVTAGGEVILTKRSASLRHHPGQIAFPGGGQDPGDATLEAAALRESHEEIGLPPDRVELLGALPPHETVTRFRVTPFVGLTADFTPRAEPGEVAEIFRVPLDFVTDPARFRIEGRYWRGSLRQYYVVPWGPYYIWGATARILHSLAERMTP